MVASTIHRHTQMEVYMGEYTLGSKLTRALSWGLYGDISNTLHVCRANTRNASFSLNNIYCDEKRQECCRRRRGNAFGKYNYFLPRREDVTSRSSDCLADKRFVSSRKWFAFSIVVDHFSLTDVILFVILKIVLCGITYAHPGL